MLQVLSATRSDRIEAAATGQPNRQKFFGSFFTIRTEREGFFLKKEAKT
jgi:hypothetical protein